MANREKHESPDTLYLLRLLFKALDYSPSTETIGYGIDGEMIKKAAEENGMLDEFQETEWYKARWRRRANRTT